jgi:O-antigen ligase
MEIIRQSLRNPKYWLYFSLMLLCVVTVCYYQLEIAMKIFLPVALVLIFSNIIDFPKSLVFVTIVTSILSLAILEYRMLPGYSFRIGIADLIVCLQIILLIIYRTLNPDKFKTKDIFSLPILLFLLAAIVSIFVSTNKVVSVSYLLLLVTGYLFYRYIILVFQTQQDLKLLTGICIVALAFIIIRALVAMSAGAAQMRAGIFLASRTGFVFSGPNGLAGILVVLLPFTFIAFYLRRLILKVVIALIFLGGVYLLTQTYSRNGYLCFIVSTFVMIAMLTKIKGKVFLLPFVVLSIPFLLIGSTIVLRLFSITMFQIDPSSLLRLVMWKLAINEVAEYPLTGVGLANFYYATRIVRIGFCHNLYLNSFAEMGLFGGISVLALVGMIFYNLFNTYRNLKEGFAKYLNVCLIGSWIAFSMNHMFDQICFFIDRTSEMKFFWLLMGLTAVFLINARRSNDETL